MCFVPSGALGALGDGGANSVSSSPGAFGAAAAMSGYAAGASGVARTGDSAVDGLLSGYKWSSNVLTYSFPGSLGNYGYAGASYTAFAAFTSAQIKAVHAILSDYSGFANLKFVASSGQSAIRFAESDAYQTGYAFYPSGSEDGGDVWLNKSSGWYKSPVAGNYAYLTLIHEIGHALGLKHAFESGTYGAVPSSVDGMPFTVMTYASYVGAKITGSYTNGWDSYAQTPMLDDIKAVQKLYGANYASHSGNTNYSWNPSTGEEFINGVGQGRPAGNKVFETIWDGGGKDTYDFSKYKTDLHIDLNPGHWTSLGSNELADLSGNGKIKAPGNIANAYQVNGNPLSLIENAAGGSGNDFIIGNSAANTLTGGAGNDVLKGGLGHDTFLFRPGLGHDVVSDFHDGHVGPGKGVHDTLDLRGLGLFNFAGLMDHAQSSAHGTLIKIDQADTILLYGITKAQLISLGGHSGDFLFI
jgi:serralysin